VKAYGAADLTFGIPFTPDTPTNIGSTSKQFTGFALALLASRAGLSMPTTVRRQAGRRNGRVGQRRGLGRGRSGTLLQSGLTLTYRRRCEIYY
jgi:hypothetical protein